MPDREIGQEALLKAIMQADHDNGHESRLSDQAFGAWGEHVGVVASDLETIGRGYVMAIRADVRAGKAQVDDAYLGCFLSAFQVGWYARGIAEGIEHEHRDLDDAGQERGRRVAEEIRRKAEEE